METKQASIKPTHRFRVGEMNVQKCVVQMITLSTRPSHQGLNRVTLLEGLLSLSPATSTPPGGCSHLSCVLQTSTSNFLQKYNFQLLNLLLLMNFSKRFHLLLLFCQRLILAKILSESCQQGQFNESVNLLRCFPVTKMQRLIPATHYLQRNPILVAKLCWELYNNHNSSYDVSHKFVNISEESDA